MYIFLYDSMMNPQNLSKILERGNILSVRPSFVKDTVMVDAERQATTDKWTKNNTMFPIMLDKRDFLTIQRNPCHIFGACVELEDDNNMLKMLDSYYSCSLHSLGENKQSDLFHRRETAISVIKFNSHEDFLNYRFEVVEVANGYSYYGNLEHHMLKYKIEKGRRNRIGLVWKTFFNIF